MANAILVVQNLFRLVRNNDCFSFVYVVYLVNMFLNNVITPGTAIVMITAGEYEFCGCRCYNGISVSYVYAVYITNSYSV